MPQPNEMVAAMLAEYAELLQISGSDPFRARNYEKAAKSVAGFSGDVSLLDATSMRQIPGAVPGRSRRRSPSSSRPARSRRWRSSAPRCPTGSGR